MTIYELIKGEMTHNISLLELREIMKKKGKSKSYPMANAILFHHTHQQKTMSDVEKDALFHLFSIYHGGYLSFIEATTQNDAIWTFSSQNSSLFG